MGFAELAGNVFHHLERAAQEAPDHPNQEVHMATVADAQAAFEAYHAAVNARMQELEAQIANVPAPEDAQPLVDAINSAEAEIAPPPAQ